MADLRATLVQTDLHWHQPQANREQLAHKLAGVGGTTDIIVLPEMFTSGFTVHPESVVHGCVTQEWMVEQARVLNAALVGSIAYQVEGIPGSKRPSYVNRLLLVAPDGHIFHYDKVHLFRMANEHQRYQPGQQRCIVDFKGWRLLLTVCYDLRFPVFCRNTVIDNRHDYDAMICVANWPQARRHHWRTLLQARAIENQAFVMGVNRVGVDGNGLSYSGDSMLVDARGEPVLDEPGEWIKTQLLKKQELMDYRQQFPVWQDADPFSLTLSGQHWP